MANESRKGALNGVPEVRLARLEWWSPSYRFDATGMPIKVNPLRFLIDECLSRWRRKAVGLFGRVVTLVGFLCLIGSTAWADDHDRLDRDDSFRSCSKTTSAAFTACRYEAADDRLIAVGNCTNVSYPDDRRDCRRQSKQAYREHIDICAAHRAGRKAFCAALGEAPYDPLIDPALFVDPDEIGESVPPNPYFLLIPGRTMVYQEGDEEIRVTVTDEIREIAGIPCREVHDVVRVDGQVVEDTLDWYAQDIDGNVWYFGEISLEYEDGVVVSIDGSWTTGVDRAKPGFAMKALPVIGENYRQEFALNNAEDGAEVLSLTGSATVPAASCNDCLVTEDFSPIIPDLLENKYFAPGVGFVLEIKPDTGERLELVEIIQN